jgi:competence protein ComEC
VVFSVGYRNRFAHPRPEVVERYRQIGSAVWRTDRDGALSFRLGHRGIGAGTERQLQPRYWATRDEQAPR